MSAVLKDVPELRAMRESDLAEVMAIEAAIYSHPWTGGNFSDSLRAGYECRTLRLGAELIGYFVLMAAAGEAHLLNLSVAARYQRSGHGTQLLREAMALARGLGARGLFLEVRPSNRGAIALYFACVTWWYWYMKSWPCNAICSSAMATMRTMWFMAW